MIPTALGHKMCGRVVHVEGRKCTKVLDTREASVLLTLSLFDKGTHRNVEDLAAEIANDLDAMGYQITEKRPR